MLREGTDHPLGAVTPLLRGADLAIANLECAVCEPGERWHGAPKAYYFRAPPCAGDALADAGIGLLSLANNHILDYDVQGLLDTLRILDAHGIAHTGSDCTTKPPPSTPSRARWRPCVRKACAGRSCRCTGGRTW
jgi:poly-gamma-glutamate capsule biosynthesis protein CapA/YwtB (metallophosphatase superfamily)